MAVFIAYGAIYGYKSFGGKIRNNTASIKAITPIISVLIANFVLIPAIELKLLGFELENVFLLYNNQLVMLSLFKDAIIAALFTYIGIHNVVNIYNYM